MSDNESGGNGGPKIVYKKEETPKVITPFDHHQLAPQPKPGDFSNIGDIKEDYSSKFK